VTQFARVTDKFPYEGNPTESDLGLRGQIVLVSADNIPSAPQTVVAEFDGNVVVFRRDELEYL
jgi:hypothetical protein